MMNHAKGCYCAGCVEERGTLDLKRAKERMDRTVRRLATAPCGKSAPLPRVRKVETFARKPAAVEPVAVALVQVAEVQVRDDRGWGMMALILMIRHSREIAIAAVMAFLAMLVWGLVWMWK